MTSIKPQDLLSQIVYLRTYSQNVNGVQENWKETVKRYFRFLIWRFRNLPMTELLRSYKRVLRKQIMPSMRLLQYAGKAIEKNEVKGYNCAFLNIDSLQAISEILFLTMSGVGVGFSVEKKHVDNIPPIFPSSSHSRNYKLKFEDSTVG
jgi:hypothetical protein